MRLTIDRSLTDSRDVEVEAAVGARLSEVLEGVTSKRAWCGSTLLVPSLHVGTYPLLHGARLRDGPGLHTATPAGLHLAAIAGPDAGAIIAIDQTVTVGAAPGRHGITDDTMDASHLLLEPGPGGRLTCRDLSSTNGTVWWRRSDGSWSWRGFRRRFTAHAGDVLSVGHTALQVRYGPGATPPGRGGHIPRAVATWRSRLPWTPAPQWKGLPDPTTVGGWTEAVTLTGPHSREAARAVILARGRRPPSPMPFDEEWLRWLPDALPGDGAILCTTPSSGRAELTLEAHATHSSFWGTSDSSPLLPIAVSAPRADALARAIAGRTVIPWPDALRWADVDRLGTQVPSGAPLRVTLGAVCSPGLEPWLVTLDARNPHLLVAGARHSGASTLLATLVAGLATHHDPRRLLVTLIGSGAHGELSPCSDLPHVTRAAVNSGGSEAMRALEETTLEALRRQEALRDSGRSDWTAWEAAGDAPARLLVVIDDFDQITGGSRTASAAIEALARPPAFVGVHLALATHRPGGAITPTLRASCTHAVALRAASEAASLEVIGIPDAAALDPVPGRAVTRIAGDVAMVQVALPSADTSPRVRRIGADEPPIRHLAETIISRFRQEASKGSDPP